ncbi:MAG: hypothetical protein ABI680_02440, partial [Chthoniobacteraceae bacterium]
MAENFPERNLDLPFVARGDRSKDAGRCLAMQAGEGHLHRARGELPVDQRERQRDGGRSVRFMQHGRFHLIGKTPDDGGEGEMGDLHAGHRRGGFAELGRADGEDRRFGLGLAEEFFEDREHEASG